MITLQLDGERTVERIFAGVIKSEADLAKFVAEVRKELKANQRLFCEIWKYDSWMRTHIPTEEQERIATHEGRNAENE